MSSEMSITVGENGPYHVQGGVPLSVQIIEADDQGNSWEWREGRTFEPQEEYWLCRCGKSANKPFCDGSHTAAGFVGPETASREPYAAGAQTIEGPELTLTDLPSLCAVARFCDAYGQVWNLVGRSDDETAYALVEREAANCPSGRLIAWSRKTKEAFEPSLEPSIGLVQDPAAGVSGPLWVRGGIEIRSADGTTYERRNRVTLCRCGASRNMPFCDASHTQTGFVDGIEDE